jgi:PAS domain S-box-containing protein
MGEIRPPLTDQKFPEPAEIARELATNILESITDGFIALDHEWQFRYINASAELFLNRRRSDLLGKNYWEEFPAAIGTQVENEYRRAVAQQTSIEFVDYSEVGRRCFEIRGYPGAHGLSIYFRDITDRKEAEELQAHLAAIVASSDDAVVSKDLHSIIKSWNMGGERIFGYTAEEVIGRSIELLIPPELKHEEAQILHRIRRGDRIEHYETIRVRKDGKRIPVSLSVSPVKNAADEIIGAAKIARDITDKKLAEEEIYRLNRHLEQRVRERTRELEKTNAQLGEQTAKLTRTNAELERFAYVSSHDLQEPLRMISGFTHLLAERYEGKLGADADDFIKYAVEGADRMSRLIKDLLKYSLLGVQEMRSAPVNFEELWNRAMMDLKVSIEKSGAVLTHDPLPTIMGDATQLGQVVQNLLANAIKFTDAVPQIHVWAERKGQEWVFGVRDNGIGIEPQYTARIFEVFQRLHSRNEYPGTGIGLAICKKVVEAHGGRMWIESEYGKGSTFYFTLPSDDGQTDRQP